MRVSNKTKTINCVCTANICRSPMAEGLLAAALKSEKEPLCSYRVISSGIAAFRGDPVFEYSLKALKEVGINMDVHQSQPMTKKLFECSDLILCMTESHRSFLRENFPSKEKPIFLFRELIPGVENAQIPDPFGGPYSFYEDCRDSLAEAIPGIIQYLKKTL